MGKFDAAIEALNTEAFYAIKTEDWDKRNNCNAAIRVLEAAAKVDKAWACGDGPDDPEKAQAVNELLHALPDDTDAKEKA